MIAAAVGAFVQAAEGRIFTLLQPAAAGAPARRQAVLVCYPGMHEMMRAQFAFRQLMTQLAGAGWASLRFDYVGTGDSDGETGALDLDTAVRDGVAAARHLLRESGAEQLVVIGLRLGALVAARLAREVRVATLVLWDPLLDGNAYLERCRRIQQEMLDFDRFHMIRSRSDASEVLGTPLGAKLREQLATFDWLKLLPACADRHVVASGGVSADAATLKQLGYVLHAVDEAAGWDTYATTQRALLAPRAIKVLLEIIASAAHA